MRTITKLAVDALLKKRNFSQSNTMVMQTENGARMYLFGKLIAINEDAIYVTNAGWFSNTTKERLNGLPNVCINQKKGEWYLNGEQWDGKLSKIA